MPKLFYLFHMNKKKKRFCKKKFVDSSSDCLER